MPTQIDWAAVAERARGMSNEALHFAILDCQKTLPSADARELAGDGGKGGGYYRDEIWIYRTEQERRGTR